MRDSFEIQFEIIASGPPISKSDSVSSQSSEDSFSTEGSFGAAMRKFVEKQQKPKHPKNSSQSRKDQINIFLEGGVTGCEYVRYRNLSWVPETAT